MACIDSLLEGVMVPMKQIESKGRLSRRPRQEPTLEESWNSLSVFNQTQRGRISLDFQGLSVGRDHSVKVIYGQTSCWFWLRLLSK